MNRDIVRAVEIQLGYAEDNLYRAKAAFRGMDDKQLAQKYGHSDQTRGEILAEYQNEVARWEAALAEAKK